MPVAVKLLNAPELRDIVAILSYTLDASHDPGYGEKMEKDHCIAEIRGILNLYNKGKGKGNGKSVADAIAHARAELQDVSANILHRAMHVWVKFMRVCFLLICIISTNVIIELTTLLHHWLIQNRFKAYLL